MESKIKNIASRSWLVTWFAEPSDFERALEDLKELVVYYIGQVEKCPKTDREHL